MTRQLSFFEGENQSLASIAGLTVLIRAAMNRAAAASPYSREQIVDRMNHLTAMAGKQLTGGKAKKISLDTLEKWLNPESDHVPSILAVEVFMRATETIDPLGAWLGQHGCAVMTPKDKKLRDLGEKKFRQKQVAREVTQLEQQLQEVMK